MKFILLCFLSPNLLLKKWYQLLFTDVILPTLLNSASIFLFTKLKLSVPDNRIYSKNMNKFSTWKCSKYPNYSNSYLKSLYPSFQTIYKSVGCIWTGKRLNKISSKISGHLINIDENVRIIINYFLN